MPEYIISADSAGHILTFSANNRHGLVLLLTMLEKEASVKTFWVQEFASTTYVSVDQAYIHIGGVYSKWRL